MIKRFAKRRKYHINNQIAAIINRQDVLTHGEYLELQQLDRSHQFWGRFS
ncbi:hypothetical protein JM93_03776 [Roseibium hamelinense]|uniref:Uncharacterized protein n=1 Tax=Roseibium hamelinense TaxID=150831 RepID=A0A562SLJ2_9HYPH|nr:hypothetical protein JM93_03776 [Roseibium hamelinense]